MEVGFAVADPKDVMMEVALTRTSYNHCPVLDLGHECAEVG